MARMIPALVALLSLALPASAAEDALFQAICLGGEKAAGRLSSLNPDGAAVLTDSTGKGAPRQVVSLRRADVPLPPLPCGPLAITVYGDRIPGRLKGSNGQSVRLEIGTEATAAEWLIPFSATRVVWLSRPRAEMPADPLRYPWLADNRRRDALLLRNADTRRGVLEKLSDTRAEVVFKPEGMESLNIPFADVAAIAFNPGLARERKPKEPIARLVLADGTRLSVITPTIRDNTLAAQTLFGQSIRFPVKELLRIDLITPKVVSLPDLKPKTTMTRGFLSTVWPPTANHNVHGEPIRMITPIGTETFDNGLGTHPFTELTYETGGKYRRFRAVVGLDAVTGKEGSAVVRIATDGKDVTPPALIKLRSGLTVEVDVDLRGVKELRVSVDLGAAGDVRGDVNWTDAFFYE